MGFRVYGLGFRVYLTGLVAFKRHLQVVYTLLMQLLKDFGGLEGRECSNYAASESLSQGFGLVYLLKAGGET